MLVDTQGLLLAAVVPPADIQEREGAYAVLAPATPRTRHGHHLWADAAYRGDFGAWVQAVRGWTSAIVQLQRAADTVGFAVQPRRWVVERTFTWLGRNRRLSKDYEAGPASAEAWMYLAMIHLMLQRLPPPRPAFSHKLLLSFREWETTGYGTGQTAPSASWLPAQGPLTARRAPRGRCAAAGQHLQRRAGRPRNRG